MKKLAIVIPVKPPGEGKSRLDGVMPASERQDLNTRLLNNTLDRVAELADLAEVYVVSKSATVLVDARKRGFIACFEPPDADLNGAVALAAKAAAENDANELMVLPIDLPWLSCARLRLLIDEFRKSWDVMIVTDNASDGTNLLIWRPIRTTKFLYGKGSATRHAAAAAELGLSVTVRRDCTLSFDLDTPQDLEVWSRGLEVRKDLADGTTRRARI